MVPVRIFHSLNRALRNIHTPNPSAPAHSRHSAGGAPEARERVARGQAGRAPARSAAAPGKNRPHRQRPDAGASPFPSKRYDANPNKANHGKNGRDGRDQILHAFLTVSRRPLRSLDLLLFFPHLWRDTRGGGSKPVYCVCNPDFRFPIPHSPFPIPHSAF